MSATDIITVTMLIITMVSGVLVYFGVKFEKPALYSVALMASWFALAVLGFILMVTLGTIVVYDTLN